MAGIKSESVADFIPESVADFVRNQQMGRAELLALVIKVLKLIGPIALSLLAGVALTRARAGTATRS